MNRRHFALCLCALILAVAGCVQTRRVESSNYMSCTAGGPCATAESASTYNERRWTGFGGPGTLARRAE
jgi:hypothetical protein